jgi:hypothetical protein
MSNPYIVHINGIEIVCNTAESVLDLIALQSRVRALRGTTRVTVPASGGSVAGRGAGRATGRGKKRGRPAKAKKITSLSKKNATLLGVFAKNPSSLNADQIAKATGAKGARGVGGSFTSLARELKALGYSIDRFVRRKKTDDGTTWSGVANSESTISKLVDGAK